ncbi:hypothetical protein [Anaerosporobacter faecicola]|uniref:hypothetical protein n=1 Tax=Anaerosporobacter faecicola TaxID=2718714 RepID=UPI001439B141|nr:hypothetical protein [Anaerosporobacter faecicola]
MVRKKDRSSQLKQALQGKKLPILTLDERWYQLLPEHEKPAHIKQLETNLNNLLKKQGQMINDIKDMKKLKKKLMNEIVANMEADNSPAGRLRAKKLEKSHQFIEELNEKMQNADDVLLDMPYEIKKANEELMVESMKVCYAKLKKNQRDISEAEQWISKTREALKLRILEKQDKEIENSSLYSYMHDILGNTVIDILDDKE